MPVLLVSRESLSSCIGSHKVNMLRMYYYNTNNAFIPDLIVTYWLESALILRFIFNYVK